jgi:hypothetical protein
VQFSLTKKERYSSVELWPAYYSTPYMCVHQYTLVFQFKPVCWRIKHHVSWRPIKKETVKHGEKGFGRLWYFSGTPAPSHQPSMKLFLDTLYAFPPCLVNFFNRSNPLFMAFMASRRKAAAKPTDNHSVQPFLFLISPFPFKPPPFLPLCVSFYS